jgi:muconate cycloisomerase
MKIAGAETMQVSLPRRRPHEWAGSITPIGTGYVIVKLLTDEGIVGLGEAPALKEWGGDHMRYYGESARSVMHMIEDYLVPAVLGHSPFEISRIHAVWDRTVKGHPYAKAALDFALYDIVGKALQTPVHQLLGGCFRQWIPVAHSIGLMAVDAAVAEASQAVSEGIRTIKLKVGKDPNRDIEVVRRMREAMGSEVRITVDANQGYVNSHQAIRVLRQMEPYDVYFAEQPVEGLEQMSRVARSIRIPLMADESAWTTHDLIEIRDRKAADLISIYTTKPGGLFKAMKVATVAGALGFGCNVNGSAETGVGNAANLHLAAAAESITLDSLIVITTLKGREQTSMAGIRYTDDIITQPFAYRDGSLRVPTGPGLGVQLDPEKVAEYRVP